MEMLLPTLLFALLFAVHGKSYKDLFQLDLTGKDIATPYVIGGRDAEKDEFPWMVSLHYRGRFICSSFLITPNIVMTAAHCVVFGDEPESPKKYKGYAGTTSRDGPKTKVQFSEIIAHPSYGDDTEYDIALMKMSSPLTISEHVKPICLAKVGDNYEEQVAQTMGWGVTDREGRKGAAKTLQTVPQDVPSNAHCAFVYEILGIPVTERHICAGGDPNSGVCFGDSGGPLVGLNETEPVALGVASFVSYRGCAYPRVPAVYTHIASYDDWIKESLGEDANSICTTTKTSSRVVVTPATTE